MFFFLLLELHAEEANYRCELCDYASKTVSALKNHCKNRHSNYYGYCCSTCGMQFKCSTGLRLHSYKHLPQQFECKQCNQKFNRPQSLATHIKALHLKVRYPCPHCDSDFSFRESLKKHIMFQHEGVRLNCKCGTVFKNKARYNVHVRICPVGETEPRVTVREVMNER